MSAKVVELSKAIVTALNAADLSIKFEATRRAVPFADIEDIKQVKVIVFDGPKAMERTTREGYSKTFKPVVAVMQKLISGDDAQRLVQIDGLQQLVEQIETELMDQDLAGLSFKAFDEEQDRDPYNVDLMKSLGAFAVAITLEYIDG